MSNLTKLLWAGLAVWAFSGPLIWAQEPGASLEASDKVTVITSERLTFDYKNKYALFEEKVVVTDPALQLTADKLTVNFDDQGKATSIKAEGKVKLQQDDKSAQAKMATYDILTGKIVLAGKPRVMRGRDILEGEIITFWRDENKMICQPQARLLIYPDEQEGSKNLFLGD